jgi:hypothetical protein
VKKSGRFLLRMKVGNVQHIREAKNEQATANGTREKSNREPMRTLRTTGVENETERE